VLSVDVIQKQFRSQTRSLHKELDTLPALRVLVSSEIDQLQYQLALERLLQPHAYLEAVVIHALSIHQSDYGLSPRVSYLLNDLNFLGSDVTLHPFTSNSNYISREAMIGFLYLLEGSKLGSVYILKKLKTMGFQSEMTHFFEASLDEHSDWQSFWEFSQTILDTEEKLERAASFAANAFRFYIAYVKNEEWCENLLYEVEESTAIQSAN